MDAPDHRLPRRGKGRPIAPVRELATAYDVIYFDIFRKVFLCNANNAARSAVALSEKLFVISTTSSRVGFFLPIDLSRQSIQGKANSLADRAPGYLARAGDDGWVKHSDACVYLWFVAALKGDAQGQAEAIGDLAAFDARWKAELEALQLAVLEAPFKKFGGTDERECVPDLLNHFLKRIALNGGQDLDAIYRGEFRASKSGRRRS